MNNYPAWYQTIQSIAPANKPVTYQQIAHACLEEYTNIFAANMQGLHACYTIDAQISVHIIKAGAPLTLHEVIGFPSLQTVFINYGIPSARLKNVTYTPQPIGKNSIIVSFCGVMEANGVEFPFDSVFILRNSNGNSNKISNHILKIFTP